MYTWRVSKNQSCTYIYGRPRHLRPVTCNYMNSGPAWESAAFKDGVWLGGKIVRWGNVICSITNTRIHTRTSLYCDVRSSRFFSSLVEVVPLAFAVWLHIFLRVKLCASVYIICTFVVYDVPWDFLDPSLLFTRYLDEITSFAIYEVEKESLLAMSGQLHNRLISLLQLIREKYLTKKNGHS